MNVLKIHYFENDFDVTNNQNYILNIENSNIFRNIISDFQNKNSENIYYLKDYQTAGKFEKNILYLSDVSMIEFDKKLTQAYYDVIQEQFFNSEKREILNSINCKIMELLNLTSMDTSVALDYSDTIGFKDILTVSKVKITDTSESYLDRIVLYLKLLKDFNDYKILVIPFLDAYLSKEELKILIKELNLLNVSLFIIVNSDRNIDGFYKYTIDNDLCEF